MTAPLAYAVQPDVMCNWQSRVYSQGRWWRYEVCAPSGGGWHSKGYHTAKGATLACRAALQRQRDAITKATQP